MNWEEIYETTRNPAQLPWNAGGPDPDLVRLVESGEIPRGTALDAGTGLGHDAVYLIQKGFDVIAIDISPSAIRLARENASAHGVFGFFQEGDIRQIPVEDAWVDVANDRGCFHLLEPADQPQAVQEIHRVLKPGGLLLLRVFLEKRQLEGLFAPMFRLLQSWEGQFAGPGAPRPKSFSMLWKKK